ncbi:MAG: hypothetical protein A2X32_12735 [Elusimicrobia bacterium GWC2_64_44]|nr:MAG: hypothetical protein A2X32_12735 [Elusimicrobia bacterium GWC2_64_44]
MEDKRVTLGEDCVEPELLSPGSSGPRSEGPRGPVPPPQPPGLLARLKAFIAAGLALLGVVLVFSGALLTSTVIGAIIGIPLLILGALVFFLLFKLLASGSPSPIIFRRF